MRRLTNWVLYSCVLFLMPLMAHGQGQIKGSLKDAETKEAIDFADVLLFKAGAEQPFMQTLPNEKGAFNLQAVQEGSYTLMIRLVGYDLFSQEDIVLDSEHPTLDMGTLLMRPLEVGLAEVEVVAQKKQVIYKLDKKIIEASSNIMATGGTAVDILENTPSIRVDAEGNVSFRGSSGFIVYVDGKPSFFTGTQALEQVPSSQIANIEIITTPSARHDSDGDVGIINIITKKDAGQGLSGMVNATGSTVGTHNIDFFLTQKSGRSRWYIGSTYGHRKRSSDFDQEKTTIVNGAKTVSHSNGPREGDTYLFAGKAGWMYELPKTSFQIDMEGGKGDPQRVGDLDYTDVRTSPDGQTTKNNYFSRDFYSLSDYFLGGSTSLTHKFNDEGHQISGGFYAKYSGDAMEYFESDLYDMNNQRAEGHRAYEHEHRWTVRANVDYVYPYSETGRIEAGYQYSSYLEDGDYKMEWWDPAKKEFYWREDIYNTFYFQQGINSIYAIWAESLQQFDFQLGLRGEHTHRVLDCSVEGTDRTYDKFDVFPSLHLGYNLPNDQQLLFSYSYRITRPALFYMEPYITYKDYYSAAIGNPDIRPEYINSFEMSYKKNWGENSFSASLFHRNRKDKIERLRVPYHQSGITLDSMANVGNDFSTGLELNGQIRVNNWWHMNLNGSVYHYKVKNKLKEYGGSDESSINYDIMLNNGFDLGRNTRVQVDGNFVGPSVVTQGRTDAFWYVNASVRQQLFKRKLTATLAFRDVFNSARYVSTITTPNLQSITNIQPKYPLIMLTLSYTFNNYKAKKTQTKASHDLFEGTMQ